MKRARMIQPKSRKILCIMLGVVMILNTILPSAGAVQMDISEAMICNLQTDYTVNPIGDDNALPVFGWNMKSNMRGQFQTAYRVMVSSTLQKLGAGNYDMWDSGKVLSGTSVNITYSGAALSACTRYYWQVRAWDKDGSTALSSEQAYFETGLMNSGWNNAQFIGRQPVGFMDTAFTIDLDVTLHSGSASIGFGGTGSSNFYMWQINAWQYNGVYLRPHKVVNGAYTLIAESDVTSSIGYSKTDIINKLIHVKIVVSGGVVSTYFNHGTTAASVVNLGETISLGKMIFRGYTSAKVTELASYDNLVLKDAEGDILYSDDFSDASNPNFVLGSGVTIADGMLSIGSSANGTYFGIMNDNITTSYTEAAPMLRREFTISKTIESARVYATAAGIYNLYLNGAKVSDDYFAPGRTEYPDNTLYQTYDVTGQLQSGGNAIGAVLGHGWYNRARGTYGDNLAFMAKLVVRYTDGTSDIVVTDSSWKYTLKGPFLDDDIYNGEKYDARRELPGWATYGYSEGGIWFTPKVYTKSSLGLGEITANLAPAVRIVKTLDAIAVSEPQDGVYIYDFGQNFAGVVQFTATGSEGQIIKVRHGEALNTADGTGKGGDGPEGTLYTDNLTTANRQYKAESTDYYTFKGDSAGETHHPQLVYHGFRYIEITGIDAPLPLSAVKGLVMSSDLEDTSTFSCSNEEVNKLYSSTVWSKLSNFFSIPTDCPQRYERMGWTGDAQIFARTATYLSNSNQFYEKYLMDLFSMQQDNGVILDAVPIGWGDKTKATNGWGDSAIIIPWQLYQQYGNTGVIRQYFDNMCAYVNHLISTSTNYIRNVGPYGDWMPNGESTPVNITDTAYCAYVCDLLSKMAAVIGRTDKAAYYAEAYQKYRSAWRQNFIKADGSLTSPTQTAYVLGLQFGLFNEEERDAAAQRLVVNIQSNGNHLKGGFLGVCFLNLVLSETGKTGTAYTLLEQNTYPSWLYPITQGATTIWETLGAYNEWTGFARLSFNHYAYGAITEWMYRDMLGIERDESDTASVGYKHFILKPTFGGSIAFAGGSYDSVYGTISSRWQLGENGGYTYHAEVPANTTATLYLPITADQQVTQGGLLAQNVQGITYLRTEGGKAVYELQSGSYNFSVGNGNVISGDINGDKAVDLKDVTTLSRYIAGWTELIYQEAALDTNGDTVVDLKDVTLLSRYVAGWNVIIHPIMDIPL